MELVKSLSPDQCEYWREQLNKAISAGKEDELLCVEDYIESLLVTAYKLGRNIEQEFAEIAKAESEA